MHLWPVASDEKQQATAALAEAPHTAAEGSAATGASLSAACETALQTSGPHTRG